MEHPRLLRERETLTAMFRIYCQDRHAPWGGELCPSCAQLLAYAERRLQKCPFGGEKPTCARCPVHCYKPARREQVREIMRFAGPRMIWRHPILALRHLLDGRAPIPRSPHPD